MSEVKYGDDSYTLRFEYPTGWDVDNITGVNIAIYDTGGSEALAATAATLYTATTLDAAASAGTNTITLASGASALQPGDRIRIADSASGPAEDATVAFYNSSTRVVTLADDMDEDHASGAAVDGLWCTYAADFSDTDTFPKGKEFRVVWSPQGSDDKDSSEIITVAGISYASSQFWADFKDDYPTDYDKLDGRNLTRYEEKRRAEFGDELNTAGIELNRVVDQPRFRAGFALYVRRFILRGTGDADTEERKVADQAWNGWWEYTVRNSSIWTDTDQDGTKDTAEEVKRDPFFGVRYP